MSKHYTVKVGQGWTITHRPPVTVAGRTMLRYEQTYEFTGNTETFLEGARGAVYCLVPASPRSGVYVARTLNGTTLRKNGTEALLVQIGDVVEDLVRPERSVTR